MYVVIQMLTDMQAKGKSEKEDEAARFAEYKTFCKECSSIDWSFK